jgi:hypothetical protein
MCIYMRCGHCVGAIRGLVPGDSLGWLCPDYLHELPGDYLSLHACVARTVHFAAPCRPSSLHCAHAALLVSHSVTVLVEALVCAQMTFVVGQSFLSMMCSMRVRSYASFCFAMAHPLISQLASSPACMQLCETQASVFGWNLISIPHAEMICVRSGASSFSLPPGWPSCPSSSSCSRLRPRVSRW